MATVELGSLSQHLDDEEVAAILKALKKNEVSLELDDHDTVVLARDIDGDLLADFLDKLDAHDAKCDIYLPMEFDFTVDAGGYKVGSAAALATILEEMKEELTEAADDEDEEEDADFDDDDDEEVDEEEEDDDEPGGANTLRLKDDQMTKLWRILYKAATSATDQGAAMFVKS
jgi:hypothetical protein